MKLKIVVTTAVLIAVGLAVPVKTRSAAHTVQILENKQCQNCDLTEADVKDARQERQQQRQDQRQDTRQERQDQRQQQPNPQPNLQPDARQERQQQRQQQQEVRQERQDQRQDTRQERQDQRQQQPNPQPNLQPDARQERQQQRQQQQEVRQERQDQRQDTRQERQEQQQDTRRERLRERDAWWLREHKTWWLPEQEAGWYQYGENVHPVQTVRSIKVHLISLTKDRVKVLIDGVNGRQEIAFDGRQTRQTVYLSPGTHKLWFKDTRDNPWIYGTLNLGRTNLIRIAFHKGKRLVRVCDDRYAWIEERYSPTESLQLNTTPIECPEITNKD